MTRESPYTEEIQDKPILLNFHLPMLEVYDGGTNPVEHVAAFWVQMALYGIANALIRRAFPTTLQ